MSGLDMFSNAVSSLLSVFGDGDPRHARLQALIMEVQHMEETVSVVDFPQYFEALRELKDLLLEELNDVYGVLRRQNVENERLSIMVTEKNKAVELMADANVEEKEELIQLRLKVKRLETEQGTALDRELKLRKVIATLRKGHNGSNGLQPKGDAPKTMAGEVQ
ncbi:unnamed protein product [Ostreobium quekettii]|uniref:Uncharacterized protein n=1 Tax=Ostreobium quekettii TaxID=121088 RepID=A0A8S1IRZ0_9CHLO|nr:unnamed protein product [Ostreobium quekettii]|eukprot:evm.model.scf_638.5 EVM.evm.TU.scf_638.5   scf_638:45737-46634(+)